MELFDGDTGRGCRVGDVAHEPFELEHPGQTVLRPHRGRQHAAVVVDEDEFHLMTDYGVDARIDQPLLHPLQRSATAVRIRRTVLVEESARGPSQSVTEDS